MTFLEQEFDAAMRELYRQTGRATGYWANYMNRDIKTKGGIATARQMLQPRSKGDIHKGLQALIDMGIKKLTVEWLASSEKFQSLFTSSELMEAASRLKSFPDHAEQIPVEPENVFPETLPETRRKYLAGASRRVLVNVYERDPRARSACLQKHGYSCSVCKMNFREKYGAIGDGFIHVHHIKPLATCRDGYELDPIKDLVPVCPNCHAMLHTQDPPLYVDELQAILELRA